MAGVKLSMGGIRGGLGGRNSLRMYIPPKYRPLTGLLSAIAITALIGLFLASIPQAKDIFIFYIPAFVAIFLLAATAFISVIKDFKRDYYVKKVSKIVLDGMSLDEFIKAYGKTEEVALRRLKYVIAIGQVNVIFNSETRIINICDEMLPIEKRLIGGNVYKEQQKKLMIGNLIASSILLLALAVNIYYSINAISGFMTENIDEILENLLLVTPFAILITVLIGITSLYLSGHLLKNSKADDTKFRKLGFWLKVIIIISLFVLPALIIFALTSASKT